MGYLITAVEAMQKYGIREQQIMNIMNFSGITIYGPSGKKLESDEFGRYYALEYDEIYNKIFKNDFNIFRITPAQQKERNELLEAISEKAKEKVVQRYLIFNSIEFKEAIEKMYPEIIINSHENLQQSTDKFIETSARQPSRNDSVAIGKWRRAIEEYERDHKQRKNDALPSRMRILLRHLGSVVTRFQPTE